MKSEYRNDPFFQIHRTRKTTLKGGVELPIYFLDTSNNHKMAENLRILDLENSRPIVVFACQNFQSRLSDGAEIN